MGLRPGTRIDRYVIERAIGSGSMGDVYVAVDQDLGRQVAIKILGEKHLHNPELEGRFVREARSVAAISHPNVVHVYSTGTFDERPYIAMELLGGKDLQSVVETNGPLSPAEAARCAIEAARGLEAAADSGLIHRDVKPSNLVRQSDGSLKVTDFGLAKPLEEDGAAKLTAHGVVVGTPDYIAPEQARGDVLDARCDIYALGGTLYYLCTGVPPYRRGTQSKDRYLKVVARHLREPPPDPRHRRANIPTELAELVLAMMAKDPDDRPSFSELIERLLPIAEPTAAPPISRKLPSQPAPTPFVGARADEAVRSTAPEKARAPTRTLLVTPTPAIAAIREPTPLSADSDGQHGAQSMTPTAEIRATTRPTASESSRVGLLRRSRAKPPTVSPVPQHRRTVVAITVLAGAVLATGVFLSVRKPAPTDSVQGSPKVTEPRVPETASTADASLPAAVKGAGERPAARPPAGMALVENDKGARWFVAREPVTRSTFLARFPDKKIGGGDPGAAASRISRTDAAAFAAAAGGRLPTADEIEASRRRDAIAPSGLWEWTADTANGLPLAVDGRGRRKPRKDRGYGDLTFRVVRDLPKE